MRLPLPTISLGKTLALTVSTSLLLGLTAQGVRGQAQTEAKHKAQEINKPFLNPDVKEFTKRFETDSREVYAQREAIVPALALKRGMAVADVGAGTGLFTRLIADRVGPEGTVFAVDIAPAFLKHIEAQAKRLGHSQVRTVLATQESTGLAAGSVDLALLCDVYHHLEEPAKSLASIRQALRENGELVVIDLDRKSGKASDFVLKHVRAEKSVFVAEIKAAGFEPVVVGNPPALKENFFLRFRKTGSQRP
jgi:ubiquinone/menaquinone biosynthesis C-methylase UbiE